MTPDEVKGWVTDNLNRKLREFGLSHWRVQTEYYRLDVKEDGFATYMTVTARCEYEKAAVEIDADRCAAAFDDSKKLEEFIEHELMHIVHSPFELTFNLVWEMLSDKQRAIFNEAWRHSQELTVRGMERMAAGLREACNVAVPVADPEPILKAPELAPTNGKHPVAH